VVAAGTFGCGPADIAGWEAVWGRGTWREGVGGVGVAFDSTGATGAAWGGAAVWAEGAAMGGNAAGGRGIAVIDGRGGGRGGGRGAGLGGAWIVDGRTGRGAGGAAGAGRAGVAP